MKHLFICLLLATLLFPALKAQEVDNAQAIEEVKASIQKIQSSASKCNAGREAFNDFITRFDTDSVFRDRRLKITPALRESFAPVIANGQFKAMLPFLKKDGDSDDFFYQFWGPEIQFGKVYLTCSWVDSFYTHVFEWTRGKDGLWYLTDINQ